MFRLRIGGDMFKSLINHFINTVVLDKRGLWGMGDGELEASVGGESSRKERSASQWVSSGEHEESKAARGSWWEQLQKWGGQTGYGAIQPDWAGIWENAQKKVQQYFHGSATDPGVAGKMKASLARRNRSDDPAAQNMMMRMGATEGGIMSDMAVQQGQKEAELSEAGRLNYLQSLASLSGQNQQGEFYTPWETEKKLDWNVRGKQTW